MAKWLKEHLGLRVSRAPPPPPPPKPDYRALTGGQPDILTAYRLHRERDFEDPYTGHRRCPDPHPSTSTSPDPQPQPQPQPQPTSIKHRLIKVDTSSAGATASPEGKVNILEDYADPFDAQTGVNQAGQDRVTANDGYMEPYEAQRMMTEIRRRGSKDAPGRPLPLYDTPYEPVENGGGEGAAERVSSQRGPRESRLPADDERPPGEYDQPWEWKKDRISKAFAVEIKVIKELPWPPPVGQLDGSTHTTDGDPLPSHCLLVQQRPPPPTQPTHEDSSVPFEEVDKNLQSPPEEEKVWPQNRLSGPCLRSLRHPGLEVPTALGERVQPQLPLVSQTWYHGAISRTDAEKQLRLCREASYLVRNSETTNNDYSLSLKSNQGFMHMRLSRTKESKYVLGVNSPPFDSVPEVIHYYSSRKLPIKGAEHMSLLYPVAIRTL